MVLIYQITRGIPINPWDMINMPVDGTASNPVGVPRDSGESPKDIAWFTQFDAPPSTINIEVQQSFDGTNWYALDSGSNPSGDYKTIRGATAQFLRFFLRTSSGGSQIRAGFFG